MGHQQPKQNTFSPSAAAESAVVAVVPLLTGGPSTERADGRAMSKRNNRMINALATILNKRAEFGPNDAFRVRLRSLDQMGNTNCYFSPVQCYFFEERKRRSATTPEGEK
uniref:Uncharacterized protein n=1 Tax=Globodera rostochiensis TaxID=31243 RepID=A0A914GQC7_GLORO